MIWIIRVIGNDVHVFERIREKQKTAIMMIYIPTTSVKNVLYVFVPPPPFLSSQLRLQYITPLVESHNKNIPLIRSSRSISGISWGYHLPPPSFMSSLEAMLSLWSESESNKRFCFVIFIPVDLFVPLIKTQIGAECKGVGL